MKNIVKHIMAGILVLAFIQGNSITEYNEKMLAPKFSLKDAEGISFSLSDTTSRPIVLCFLSKTPDNEIGRLWMDESHKWVNHLKEKYADNISIITIKNMTNAPRFMPKSLIKQKLKCEPNRILIDWTGLVCQQYQIENYFALIIIDSEKNIIYSISESFSKIKFENLVETNKMYLKERK